jgi:hypothetical protein
MRDVLYRHRDSRSGRRRVRHTPLGERLDARGVIASSIALGALVAGATAGGAVASGAIQSRAIGKSADKQTQAANYAADVQSRSTADALKFQKEQALRDQERFEATQRANYDQWAAREGRLGTLGEMIGMGSRNIPGYVPVTAGGTTTTARGATPSASVPGGNYQALFQSLTAGKPPTPEVLTALGPELQRYGIALAPNAAGVNGKIKLPTGQIVDVIEAAGAGGKNWQWLTGSGSTRSPYVATASSMLAPVQLSPALQAGQWTAASMMRG